jgi:hypothetical protein
MPESNVRQIPVQQLTVVASDPEPSGLRLALEMRLPGIPMRTVMERLITYFENGGSSEQMPVFGLTSAQADCIRAMAPSSRARNLEYTLGAHEAVIHGILFQMEQQ